MIKELDIIKSLKDINSKVLMGCVGTVLMVFPDFPTAYMVEFFDDEFKNSLDVIIVKAGEIVKIDL